MIYLDTSCGNNKKKTKGKGEITGHSHFILFRIMLDVSKSIQEICVYIYIYVDVSQLFKNYLVARNILQSNINFCNIIFQILFTYFSHF